MATLFSFSECVPRRPAQTSQLELSTNCLHDPATRGRRSERLDLAPDEKLYGTVLVDMDNTLNDWDAQFKWLMRRFHPNVELLEPSQRDQYSIERNYPEEHRERICALTSLKGFWSTMPVAKGAVRALNEMLARGIDVRIVSTPDEQYTGRCAQEKFEWLETNFGAEWKSRLILTSDKTLVKGTCLIDDKPTAMLGVSDPSWKLILFCQPYNRTVSNAAGTLHSWDEWLDTLLPYLQRNSN